MNGGMDVLDCTMTDLVDTMIAAGGGGWSAHRL